MSGGERLCWFYLLIPVAGYPMALVVPHSFFNRYFIGVLPGIAIRVTCLLYRQFGNATVTSWMILIFLAAFAMAHEEERCSTRNTSGHLAITRRKHV
jgi:hypothetical protein